MNKTTVSTCVVIILILLLVGWYAYTVSQSDQVTEPNSAQSALTTPVGIAEYTDINGNPVSLSDYLGSVLVVNTWATWCPACKEELIDFADLAELYKGQEVVVLAINRAEPANTAQAFLNSIQVAEGPELVLDPSDHYYKTIAGFTMSETVFYDTAGNIIFHKRGSMNLEEMVVHTEAALKASVRD